jgi:hypothetical protein
MDFMLRLLTSLGSLFLLPLSRGDRMDQLETNRKDTGFPNSLWARLCLLDIISTAFGYE